MNEAPPLPLRMQQKNYTRQRLLQVSRELFASQGMAATGIDEIARAAGTSRATVYTHFAGKQEIIRELLGEMWERCHDLCRSFDALPDCAAPSVHGWLQQVFASWDNYAESTKALLREMQGGVSDSDWQRHFEDQAEALMHTRTKWMHFTPDEAHRRAFLLLVQLHRTLSSWYYGGWSTDRDALLHTLTDIWCATLKPRGT